jgi:hypothetical protein
MKSLVFFWNSSRTGRSLVISAGIGFLITAFGWLPYYRLDLVDGGRLSIFFEAMAALFMPGLLMAGAVGGNFHETNLAFGFIANFVFYSVCFFFISKIWLRNRRPK